MATKYNRCILYPKSWDDCVCRAGSDVSGTDDNSWICSDIYSDTCPWLREYLENDERNKDGI